MNPKIPCVYNVCQNSWSWFRHVNWRWTNRNKTIWECQTIQFILGKFVTQAPVAPTAVQATLLVCGSSPNDSRPRDSCDRGSPVPTGIWHLTCAKTSPDSMVLLSCEGLWRPTSHEHVALNLDFAAKSNTFLAEHNPVGLLNSIFMNFAPPKVMV